jgi:hypothetical protein
VRDARGRWLPGGASPNPKGRPTKIPNEFVDQSDIRRFANTLVPITLHGRTVYVVREEALLLKMFETAMKGNASAQRHLYSLIEKNKEQLATLMAQYEEMLHELYINNPHHGDPDFQLNPEAEIWFARLQNLLNHHFPDLYPPINCDLGDDNSED